MQQILSLSIPFFGLILIGWVAARIVRLPEVGLAWLQLFVIYIALPALFFQILSKTPIEELADGAFVAATTSATVIVFALAFGVGMLASRGSIPSATIQAVIGSYSNIGYMGPGITLAALGPAAAVPTALIFCFDNTFLFVAVPVLMAIGGDRPGGVGATALTCLRRIFTHPFIIASIAGVAAAALHLHPPEPIDQLLTMLRGAAAPCALFALGVTVGLRRVTRIEKELPALLLIKLVVHPALVLGLVVAFAGAPPTWTATAMLMASLPPAANCFVLASQYNVYVERASAAVMVGTVASVASVTFALWMIAAGLVPGG